MNGAACGRSARLAGEDLSPQGDSGRSSALTRGRPERAAEAKAIADLGRWPTSAVATDQRNAMTTREPGDGGTRQLKVMRAAAGKARRVASAKRGHAPAWGSAAAAMASGMRETGRAVARGRDGGRPG